MPYTKGFSSEYELDIHFDKHGAEFDAEDKVQYLAFADEFLGAKSDENTRDCTRQSDGAMVRVNTHTEVVGILRKNNTIATYYSKRIRNRRRYPSILDYWKELCRQ